MSLEIARTKGDRVIYLVFDDPSLAEDVTAEMKKNGFHPVYLRSMSELSEECGKHLPSTIVIDFDLISESNGGAETLESLRQQYPGLPTVVTIAGVDDIRSRLYAAHIGVRRFLSKPLDVIKLTHTVDNLRVWNPVEPYSVLIIDNDESQLEEYRGILSRSGMRVHVLSEPLRVLDVLEDLMPDVIIIDDDIKECSEVNLAKVIRQSDTWSLVPIIFLTTETDKSGQLINMEFGDHDSLLKPVDPEYFLSFISVKAKEAHKAIQSSNHLKRVLRDNSYQISSMNHHDIVSIADVGGRITYVNDLFCETSGYEREDLIGHNHRILKSGRHPQSFYIELWEVISSGSIWKGTICNRKKDGGEYWVNSTIVPFLDDDGRPYQYISVRTEITSLVQSERHLKHLVSSTPATIYVRDKLPPYAATYVSPNIEQNLGYTSDQFTTDESFWIDHLHHEDVRRVIAEMPQLFENGYHKQEYRFLMADGSYRWIQDELRLTHDENGEVRDIIGSWVDITERKDAEITEAFTLRQLKEAQAIARIGSWNANMETGELTWSDEIYSIFGLDPDVIEPSIELFHSMVHPEDFEIVRESEERAKETGRHDVVHRIERSDGEVRYVHEMARAETDSEGKLKALAGTVQDVTERIESEKRLQDTQSRFEFAVEGAGDGVWDWDMRTDAMKFSKLYMSMLGYEEFELPHMADTWRKGIHPDDMPRVQKRLGEYLSGKIPVFAVELRMRSKGDSYKWILCRGTVVSHDRDGAPTRMIGIHSEITERVEAEIGLRKYNEVLEIIAKGGEIEEVLLSVIEHAEVMLNGATCTILLLDESQECFSTCIAPGLPECFNESVHGLEIGPGVGSCGEAAYTGKPVIVSDITTHENWVESKDLADRTGLRSCWSQPILSSTGEVLGAFAIYYPVPREPDDSEMQFVSELARFVAIIVERSIARDALISAKEEAENANRAKSLFLSSMSHELRTPMNAIMGFSQLLKIDNDCPLNESQQENVSEITKASNHLLNLINDVLDLAKIEAGRIELSIESILVGEVIHEVAQLIMPLAQKRGIEIGIFFDEQESSYEDLDKKQVSVRADRTRFKQALLNLLSNAVKYNTEEGRIIINCGTTDERRVRISVTDTGPGMTSEQMKGLFKAFNRLGAEQSEIEGTGIGLVITKNIVELMGGEVGVESKQECGSTFWLELPKDTSHIVRKASESDAPEDDVISQSTTDVDCSVLYIEDNPANLRLVNQLLSRRSNVRMWSAPEPLLGLELADEHIPDLILLDINLPGMNGFEVLKRLRQKEKTEHIPVVAVSANAMPKDIERGLESGFDEYVTKPIDVVALMDIVDMYLLRKSYETKS